MGRQYIRVSMSGEIVLEGPDNILLYINNMPNHLTLKYPYLMRVEVGVEYDDCVCAPEVDTDATGARRQKVDEDV